MRLYHAIEARFGGIKVEVFLFPGLSWIAISAHIPTDTKLSFTYSRTSCICCSLSSSTGRAISISLVSAVNPHLIKNFGNNSIRKVKSDPADAKKIARYPQFRAIISSQYIFLRAGKYGGSKLVPKSRN